MGNAVELSGRVCMLVHKAYPHDVRVRRAAEALTDAGMEVHVVCTGRSVRSDGVPEAKQDNIKGVRVHRLSLNCNYGGKLQYIFEYAALTVMGMLTLTQLHLKKRFDVIHIHNMPDMLVFAGMIPKWSGATLVLDVHDPMSELFQLNYHMKESSLLLWAMKLQERISYKFAHRLVTVSSPMAENIAQKIHCDKHEITVVQNVPDLHLFPMKDGKVQWPRHKDSFVVLYAGTVTEHYRLDVAVRAIAIASKTIPNIRLQILGRGNRMSHVLETAKALGISERVEFLNPVPQDAVKEIIADADVGISSHQASLFGDLYFSNKLLEFMSQDLPVVTSKTKTVAKYLPEDSVFFFQPGDPHHCAQQFLAIWNEPNLVQQKLKNARAVVKYLNWQIVKEHLIHFYRDLRKTQT